MRLVSLGVSAALVFLLMGHLDMILAGEQRVSLDLRDAEVSGLIRLLAEVGGLNVVISQEVRATVSVRLDNVSVQDALQTLLEATGLATVRTGAVIGILPRERLLKYQMQDAEAHALPPVTFRTEIVKLQFAKATELAVILAPFLSRWGKISADYRTNSLIIRDARDSSVFQLLGYKREEAKQ